MINLLYIDDDKKNRDSLKELLQDDIIADLKINIDCSDKFDNAIAAIRSNRYHIVILDIINGNPNNGGVEDGLTVLKDIQNQCFIPVIFYSGNTAKVEDFKSQIIGVVTKGDDGVDVLKSEIKRLVGLNLPFIKERVYSYLEQELKEFFWQIIHKERAKFSPDNKDMSLGYLMLRKLSSSLSKTKIYDILKDTSYDIDKVHPMEYYLYPTNIESEFESAEILQKEDDVYVILTPDCDFISRGNGERKVGKVLLAKTTLLSERKEFKDYNKNKEKYGDKLKKLIESRLGDRYFFLPKTPFIDNRIIDFQNKEMADYVQLQEYKRVAKLDSPYAQAMVASFIRYYNRIGYPDINAEIILENLG